MVGSGSVGWGLLAAAVLTAPLTVLGGTLTPQLVLDLRSAADVALSPDGAQILYRLDRPRTEDEPLGGQVGELWSVPAAGGTAQRINDAGFDARQPQWSPDGTQIAWIARGDAAGLPQLYVRRERDGAPVVVTNAPSGVEAFRWGPDSGRIAFTAPDGPSIDRVRAQKQGRDWVIFGEPVSQVRLHVIDLHSSTTTPVTPADLTVHDFDWSPDGARFVIAAAPTPWEDDRLLRSQPYLVAATGGVPELLSKHFGRLSHPRWSSDGKWIAWLGSTHITDPWAGTVFAMRVEAGSTPQALTAAYVGSVVWLGARPGHASAMVFVGEERQDTRVYSLDLGTGRITALARGGEVFSDAPSFSRDGYAFAVAAHTPSHPNEVFVGRASGGALRRLTRSNAALDQVTLGEQSIARWQSVDGLEIEGVLVKPVGFQEGVRYPVVLHVHGGSESIALNGWQGSYRDWGQLLAARGYLTLYPNYRGSRGRGVAFVRGNRGDVMGREFEDILAGLDHVIELGLADRDRAGIYGFSWGGYAAGWGATFASHRFKAAVGGAGIYNWISEAGTNDTRMHEQLAHWDAALYEHFPLYLARSPIYEIRRANTPVLLLHGERDESCPLGQAIEFHTALKWKGVPVELVIYPREGHGLKEQAHRADFLTRGLEWLDRYLKGPRP